MKSHSFAIRSSCVVTLFAAAGLILLPGVRAQGQQAPPVTVQRLTSDVFVTQGGAGSNIGVIVGKNAAFVVDTKISLQSAQDALKQISDVNTLPINTAIITHSDADHVNGLAAFPKGITVIAQENCKKEMEASESGRNPAPKDYLPTVTVAEKKNMTIDGMRVKLRHWAPAHTSGDLIIYLPSEGIVFTGDIINPTVPYTGIHPEKNGSIEGWVKTVNGMLALKADTFVPGHGPVQTRADVQAKLVKVTAQRDKIKAMMAKGETLPQIKMELSEPVNVAPAYPGGPAPVTFTDVVFMEYSSTAKS